MEVHSSLFSFVKQHQYHTTDSKKMTEKLAEKALLYYNSVVMYKRSNCCIAQIEERINYDIYEA